MKWPLFFVAFLVLGGCAGGGAALRDAAPGASGAPAGSVATEAPPTLPAEAAAAPAPAEPSPPAAEEIEFNPFEGEETGPVSVADPFEPLNRASFWFNDKLYFYLMKPVARGVRYVVPEPVRTGVDNFFSNVATPVRAVNALLQLKVADATTECLRFIINTTLGGLGFWDVAQDYGGIKKKDEDFGQTLGTYGLGHGFYWVLPVFGPSSLRDAVGRGGDYFLDPWRYSHLTEFERAAVKGTDMVNMISLDKDTYEAVVEQSLDPYVTLRNGYLQLRRAKTEE